MSIFMKERVIETVQVGTRTATVSRRSQRYLLETVVAVLMNGLPGDREPCYVVSFGLADRAEHTFATLSEARAFVAAST